MQRLGIIVEVLCDIPWPNRLGISLTGKNRNQVHVPVFQCKTNPISNPLSQFNIEKTHPTLYQSIRGNHCVKCIENYQSCNAQWKPPSLVNLLFLSYFIPSTNYYLLLLIMPYPVSPSQVQSLGYSGRHILPKINSFKTPYITWGSSNVRTCIDLME